MWSTTRQGWPVAGGIIELLAVDLSGDLLVIRVIARSNRITQQWSWRNEESRVLAFGSWLVISERPEVSRYPVHLAIRVSSDVRSQRLQRLSGIGWGRR